MQAVSNIIELGPEGQLPKKEKGRISKRDPAFSKEDEI